jgi:hypothetical protein
MSILGRVEQLVLLGIFGFQGFFMTVRQKPAGFAPPPGRLRNSYWPPASVSGERFQLAAYNSSTRRAVLRATRMNRQLIFS